jgi:hypothetical protein
MEKAANWYVKCELIVIGPDEGPVKATLEYEATTEEMAKQIQSDLAEYFNSKNEKEAE